MPHTTASDVQPRTPITSANDLLTARDVVAMLGVTTRRSPSGKPRNEAVPVSIVRLVVPLRLACGMHTRTAPDTP